MNTLHPYKCIHLVTLHSFHDDQNIVAVAAAIATHRRVRVLVGDPVHGIVTKTVLKTLPGVVRAEGLGGYRVTVGGGHPGVGWGVCEGPGVRWEVGLISELK